MEILKELYDAYMTMRKEGSNIPLRVERKDKPESFQIRKIMIDPPGWCLIIRKLDNLYECISLTEWVELARTEKPFPYLLIQEATLVPLPSFLYLSEEFLENYTKAVAKTGEDMVYKVLDYVLTTKIPKKGLYRKFLEEETTRLEAFSLSEIIKKIEKEENTARIITIIIPYILKKAIEAKYANIPSAKTLNKTLRGKNWLGYLESGKIKLYLSKDIKGKKVQIKLGGQVIYEGEGKEQMVIKNIPQIPDFSILEKELEVEVV